jgi:hypothetical protein
MTAASTREDLDMTAASLLPVLDMTAASPTLSPSLPSLPLLPLKKMIVEGASGHDMIMCCVANATEEVYLFEELRREVAEIPFDI